MIKKYGLGFKKSKSARQNLIMLKKLTEELLITVNQQDEEKILNARQPLFMEETDGNITISVRL